MTTRHSSWWQKIKQHRVSIGVGAMVFVVIIAFIIAGYWFDWTGFNGYNKVTITHIISGTNAGTVTRTEEYQPGKALWDWLQLLGILAIPVVVGFGAVWFTTQQGKVADEENKDNQRETALQTYIDKMSELLLHEKLRDSAEGDEVRKIARVRTITILFQLDAKRIEFVFTYLHETGLMPYTSLSSTEGIKSIVSLSGANLFKINFRQATIPNSDLSQVNFSQGDLSQATLNYADLTGALFILANLRGAFLEGTNMAGAVLDKADLSGANLRGAFLPNALISQAILVGANLSDTDLSDADLNNTDLRGADLSKADLRGANLTGARITEEQLKQAKSLKGATMPDGSKHP